MVLNGMDLLLVYRVYKAFKVSQVLRVIKELA
jgi:hypothetical protein